MLTGAALLLTSWADDVLLPEIRTFFLYVYVTSFLAGWVLFWRTRKNQNWANIIALMLLLLESIPFLLGLVVWLVFTLDDKPWITL